MTEQYFYNSGFNQQLQGYNQEAEIARELQRRKAENAARERDEKKLIEGNEELNRLKKMIQSGYQNKERSKQIAEKQVRRIDELKQQAHIEHELLRNRKLEEQAEREKEQRKRIVQLESRNVIEKQMIQKAERSKEAYEQYLREKAMVDQVIQKMQEDHALAIELEKNKKKTAIEDMNFALKMKEEQRVYEKELITKENQAYLAYIKEMDARESAIKEKKAAEEAVKNAIFQKLKEQDERRKRERDELDNLRMTLYQEEYEAEARKKEREELQKKERQKFEMQRAEYMARENKRRQQEEERALQETFRRAMMDKFSQDDKLDQLAQQKRRMKELEHKREVEKLWQEKLTEYREQKAREMEEVRKVQDDESWKQEIIRRQKERLLKEHMPNLEGYAPKELQKTFANMGHTGKMPWTGYAQAFKIK